MGDPSGLRVHPTVDIRFPRGMKACQAPVSESPRYSHCHRADARPRVQSKPRKSPPGLVWGQKTRQFPPHLLREDKHKVHVSHVQPIIQPNKGQAVSTKGVGAGGAVPSRGLNQVSHVWNYLEESGLTRCSTARWLHERKETTLFPFRVKSESPEIAHVCEEKAAGYFPSWACNVDFVDSAGSRGLSGGRKARGAEAHHHAQPRVCQQLTGLKFKEQSDRRRSLGRDFLPCVCQQTPSVRAPSSHPLEPEKGAIHTQTRLLFGHDLIGQQCWKDCRTAVIWY